ncbi:ABC transporter substrate-binding protein [Rugamonas sp.]|uniref:substrate-binding periplasmic protein n=1 Tax=Rugamonas sp. TaxID=1926287 RepID=UPI0025F6322E|nr:transporter substrate-binding domain-containing protein [Rugamonas sp.]
MKPLRLIATLLCFWYALAGGAVAAVTEIRTAAQTDSEPKFVRTVVNGSTSVSGMCIDIFHAIEKIDPELKFVGDQEWEPPARIDAHIFYGKKDVGCGLVKNKYRDGRFVILEPAMFTFRYALAVRADDDVAISSWDDVIRLGHDNVVLAVQGMGPSKQLEDIAGLRLDTGSGSIQQNFEKLLAHRGRFVYFRAPGLVYLLHEFCVQDKIKILPTTMNTLPLYMLVGKHVAPPTIERLRLALAKLKDNGELDRIQKRWENFGVDHPPACAKH